MVFRSIHPFSNSQMSNMQSTDPKKPSRMSNLAPDEKFCLKLFLYITYIFLFKTLAAVLSELFHVMFMVRGKPSQNVISDLPGKRVLLSDESSLWKCGHLD